MKPFRLPAIQGLCAFLLAVICCSGGASHLAQTASVRRVLFIGNSLTYTNEMPLIVRALAEASGQPPLAGRAVVFGGFALEDHWKEGQARKAIVEGGWEMVVMQQGPSASSEGRRSLLEYTRRFAEEIRRAGGRPAVYMVWPSTARKQDFGGVIESYRQAAEAVDGLLFPVGEAWLGAQRRDPKIELYSSDGLHPTPAGSYLAALVIYQQIYDRPTAGLPSTLKLASGKRIEIPEAQARVLQEAASEANDKTRKPQK